MSMLTHEQATEETDEVLDDEGPEGLVEDAQVGGGGAGLRQRRGGGASAGAAYVCWHVGTRVTVSWLADEGTVGMRTGGTRGLGESSLRGRGGLLLLLATIQEVRDEGWDDG